MSQGWERAIRYLADLARQGWLSGGACCRVAELPSGKAPPLQAIGRPSASKTKSICTRTQIGYIPTGNRVLKEIVCHVIKKRRGNQG